MVDVKWTIQGKEFANCNCSYGCPCQFNALPTHGNCQAVVGIEIEKGHHGQTPLDGLKVAGVFAWPGPIHEGKGVGMAVVDKRATPEQRDALLRIMGGKDTKPGATMFYVYSSMLMEVHKPVFADIDFKVDVDGRRARLLVPGLIEMRGEPIVNPVTGDQHRVRIDLPAGFEYTVAEIGRGWSKTSGPVKLELADSYGQFARLHLCQDGIVR